MFFIPYFMSILWLNVRFCQCMSNVQYYFLIDFVPFRRPVTRDIQGNLVLKGSFNVVFIYLFFKGFTRTFFKTALYVFCLLSQVETIHPSDKELSSAMIGQSLWNPVFILGQSIFKAASTVWKLISKCHGCNFFATIKTGEILANSSKHGGVFNCRLWYFPY